MSEANKEPANPAVPANLTNPQKDKKILETRTHKLQLNKDEYELTMGIDDSDYIHFKLRQTNSISSSYYTSNFDLITITKLLYVINKDIKDVFNFYDKVLAKNKVKLVYNKEKNLMLLNFTNIINFDELVETSLELKEVKLTTEEIFEIIFNEVKNLKDQGMTKDFMDILDKRINDIKEDKSGKEKLINELKTEINGIKEYVDKKIEEAEIKNKKKFDEIEKRIKNLEEKNKKKEIEEEEKLKKEKENEKLQLESNDNINLINNFDSDIQKYKNVEVIANDLDIRFMKSVAVYSIKREEKIKYEIAYPDNKNGYNIIFYDLKINKISNNLSNAHSSYIYRIKHYYQSLLNRHILLTSSADKSVKLWNISSNPIKKYFINK